jgi:curved DNA-binding protein CbpA
MPGSRKVDYYAVLGLDPKKKAEISKSDIQRAYRQAALQAHPDKKEKTPTAQAAASAAFQLIQEAYEVLNDSYKRESYDAINNTSKRASEDQEDIETPAEKAKYTKFFEIFLEDLTNTSTTELRIEGKTGKFILKALRDNENFNKFLLALKNAHSIKNIYLDDQNTSNANKKNYIFPPTEQGNAKFALFYTLLSQHTSIEKVELTNCKIDDKRANLLAKAIAANPRIHTLAICNTKENDVAVTSLGLANIAAPFRDTMSLKSLTLKGQELNCVGDDELQFYIQQEVQASTTLPNETYVDEIIDTRIDFAASLNSLSALNIAQNGLTHDHITRLLNNLANNKFQLRSLNLASNPLQNEGVTALFNALKTNTGLTELDCSTESNSLMLRTWINDNELGTLMKEMLTENHTLLSLNCGRLGIREGVPELCEGLQRNKTLTALNIERNEINEDGFQAIANMLKVNDSLTQLNLTYSKPSVDSVIAISTALTTNSHLESLGLMFPERADQLKNGAALTSIQSMLEKNSTLVSLFDPYTFFDVRGYAYPNPIIQKRLQRNISRKNGEAVEPEETQTAELTKAPPAQTTTPPANYIDKNREDLARASLKKIYKELYLYTLYLSQNMLKDFPKKMKTNSMFSDQTPLNKISLLKLIDVEKNFSALGNQLLTITEKFNNFDIDKKNTRLQKGIAKLSVLQEVCAAGANSALSQIENLKNLKDVFETHRPKLESYRDTRLMKTLRIIAGILTGMTIILLPITYHLWKTQGMKMTKKVDAILKEKATNNKTKKSNRTR